MVEAAHRLEVLGYSFEKESEVMGMNFQSYKRKVGNDEYAVELVRWHRDDRIKDFHFYGRTNEARFNSQDARDALLRGIGWDFLALINGDEDYYRAIDNMKEAEGDGVPRYEGRATTAEGWRIDAIEYTGYYKSEKNHIGVFSFGATHLETDENITVTALQAFNQQMAEAKREADGRKAELLKGE